MWASLTTCILQVSDDGRYVLLSIREGCDPVNRLWYCDLKTTPQGITGVLQVILVSMYSNTVSVMRLFLPSLLTLEYFSDLN